MKHYKKRNTHHFKSTKLVVVMVIALALICAGFRGYAIAENATKYAKLLENKVITTAKANETILGQNQALKQSLLDQQLTFSSTIKTPDYIKDSVRSYIHQYFPKDQWDNAEKISTCEANLNDHAYNNHNKDKSIDYGAFQINSVHKDQFKAQFGVDLAVGGFDTDHNVKFASWLYSKSGWSPWACSPLVLGVK